MECGGLPCLLPAGRSFSSASEEKLFNVDASAS
jgi:hypothetical protein